MKHLSTIVVIIIAIGLSMVVLVRTPSESGAVPTSTIDEGHDASLATLRDFNELLLTLKTRVHQSEDTLDSVVADTDIPLTQRPAFSLEYRTRIPELSLIPVNTLGYTLTPDDELERLISEQQDPHMMYTLAARKEGSDPMQSLHLYHEAALRGSVESLARSANLLREIALQEEGVSPELYDALFEEAYARYIASIMFGYGEHLHQFIGNVAIPDTVCTSGVTVAATLNSERARMGMRPIPVMFGGRDILHIMRENYGLCN